MEHRKRVLCDHGSQNFLSQNAKWTGYREFLGNLRHTAEYKTKVSRKG
jgi:hypothetical protein